CRQGYSPPYSF
nr:immunoglobulin light chain junction region [Macaca mulatta]